jgi:ABC-2 type transport system ATP-binding protein
MDTTVEATGLTKRYNGKTVVDGLTMTLRAGDVFGLLGPNGAGKTTTILMMLGLTEPSEGEVRILGHDPRREPLVVKRRVGYLPDAVGFYDNLTGRENLRFSAQLNRLDPRATEDRITVVLREVGLPAAGDAFVGTYSRGMRQRLGIADALLKEPEVLILDEPTTAIDPEGVQDILGLIRRLADERRVTVLLSSHLLHQVQSVCDRVAIFVEGRIAALGTPQELAETSAGPEQVEVTADRDPGEIAAGAGFVESVTAGRAAHTYVVTVAPGSTADLVSLLAREGVAVTGVRRVGHDLDEIYRRYFEKEMADA